MFDVSLIELAVIALVALLVLGPEKLPRAARTVGLYVRKAKQSWYSVRADIERELAADELKRSLERTSASVRGEIARATAPLVDPAPLERTTSVAPPTSSDTAPALRDEPPQA